MIGLTIIVRLLLISKLLMFFSIEIMSLVSIEKSLKNKNLLTLLIWITFFRSFFI